MKSYSESKIFKPHHLRGLFAATAVVRSLPDEFDGEPLRCHEVAHIVQKHLLLAEVYTVVADGKYAAVEHSWLLFDDLHRQALLDPYAVGRLPQVQLVHDWLDLASLYVSGPPRDDLRLDVIKALTP